MFRENLRRFKLRFPKKSDSDNPLPFTEQIWRNAVEANRDSAAAVFNNKFKRAIGSVTDAISRNESTEANAVVRFYFASFGFGDQISWAKEENNCIIEGDCGEGRGGRQCDSPKCD
jgi:hypothetical protein